MLRQVSAAADDQSAWYTDAFFDLFVWWDEQGEILSFQLTYDKAKTERCLIWKRDEGSTHMQIDDGEVAGRHKASPIMVQDGPLTATLAETFRRESAGINSAVAAFVLEKIEQARQQNTRPTRSILVTPPDPDRGEMDS